MSHPQPMPAGARLGLLVVMAAIVVPVVFGGMGLGVMLAGQAVGIDLSPGWITLLAAGPTAYVSWRLWRVAIAPDERERW